MKALAFIPDLKKGHQDTLVYTPLCGEGEVDKWTLLLPQKMRRKSAEIPKKIITERIHLEEDVKSSAYKAR